MIAFGSTEISKVCLGSDELNKVCLGSTEIWSASTPVSNPYITDGLEFMFDGIWNKAIGEHDSTYTALNDLTGKNTLTQTGALTINDKYASFDGSTYITFNNSNIISAINSNKLRIEMIMLPKSHGSMYNCGYLDLGNTVRGYWIWDNSNYAFSGISYRKDSNALGPNIRWNQLSSYVCRVILSGNYCYIKYGSNSTWSQTAGNTGNVTNDLCQVGKIGSFGMGIFDLYALRIYTRTFTTEEQNHNLALDQERFGLTF